MADTALIDNIEAIIDSCALFRRSAEAKAIVELLGQLRRTPIAAVGGDLPPLPTVEDIAGLPDLMDEWAQSPRGPKALAAWKRLAQKIDAHFAAVALNRAQQGEPVACVICCSDEPRTGTCGSDDPRALCNRASIKEAAPADAPQINQPVTQLELVMMSLQDAREVAMRNTVAARIPESGDFGRIAQNLDYAITAIESAEAARRAPVEDAREQPQGERRDEFEQAMKAKGHRTERMDNGEYVGMTSYRWEGWAARVENEGKGK